MGRYLIVRQAALYSSCCDVQKWEKLHCFPINRCTFDSIYSGVRWVTPALCYDTSAQCTGFAPIREGIRRMLRDALVAGNPVMPRHDQNAGPLAVN